MKRTIAVIFIWMCALAIACGTATAAEIKIGVIDTQKIMRDSKGAKKARDILMKDLEAKRAQFKSEEEQALKLQEEIKRDAQIMEPSARQEKTEKLEKEIKELSRLRNDLEEDLRKKDAELARKIRAEILGIAKELLQKEKFTIIIDKGFLVASDDAVDLTDRIIKLYDAVSR